METEGWCTIQSDPGVFTELIRNIGVKGAQVEEIYSLQDSSLIDNLKPIYGLIFLFKWTKQEPRQCQVYYDPQLFFCNQVIQNACATQALLGILLNSPDIEIGQNLKEFQEFSKDMDSQMRGLALSNSSIIQKEHNSFARPEPFFTDPEDDSQKKGKPKDVFHFISFIPFKGKVYQLDGLQEGPIIVGSYESEDKWLDVAKQEITKRIQQYSEQEVRFNLMGIVRDIKQQLQTDIENAERTQFLLYNQMKEIEKPLDGMMESDFSDLTKKSFKQEDLAQLQFSIPNTFDDIMNALANKNNQIEINNMRIQEENDKMEQYRQQNIRRQHNYIPFVLELLKIAAKKDKLIPLIQAAKQKNEEKDKQQQK